MKNFTLLISVLLLSLTTNAQFGNPSVIDSNITVQIRNIIAVDIDNDGLKDIVVSYYTDTLKWYKNLGNNTFATPELITENIAKPFFIDIGDVDNDSKTDLLVTNNNGNNSQVVLINNNDLNQSIIIDDTLAVGTYRAYFTDFDNDGDNDIIACSDLMITLYLNTGAGVFGNRIVILDGAEFYNLTSADFNGDNFPDIAVSSSNGTQVLLNDTSGGLTGPNTLDLGLNGFVTDTDIDNDGQTDIIFPSNTPNNYDIYKNTGGTFTLNQSATFNQLNIQNPAFSTATVNTDSFTDAVYSDKNDNRALYWQGNDGTGTFQNPQLIDSSEIYDAIFLADMDNDGDNDILWYGFNFSSNQKKIGFIENNTYTLGINDNIKTTPIRIYPNPGSTLLNIELQDEISTVEIYSTNGAKIATHKKSQIDISKLTSDTYLLKITTSNNKIFTTKFIKQ